ncbi:hypothetical protein [Paenibacillus sp. FJAT-26967]|uniref:hypothetical protein n=1 Tax=Paenibacillus sp. FJAT-26967 TaxID=1729690 RepID=UPI0008394379|nr:hypothetical protein [Paenibacillus sp. FJAT-26967]
MTSENERMYLIWELEQFIQKVEETHEPAETLQPFVDDIKNIMIKHVKVAGSINLYPVDR